MPYARPGTWCSVQSMLGNGLDSAAFPVSARKEAQEQQGWGQHACNASEISGVMRPIDFCIEMSHGMPARLRWERS